ncbi:MAG: hypothetical protein AAFQ94_26285 [Bacteroidota bacterium]
MKTEDKDLIEKKLREQLSLEEEKSFTAKLEEDEEFKQAYIFEKQLFENLDDSDWNLTENLESTEIKEYAKLFKSEDARKLADQLKVITAEHRNSATTRPKSRKLYWITGLAATLLIILVSVFVFYPNSQSTNQLYTTYLDVSEVPSMIPRGDREDALKVKAQDLFESKKYKEAIPLFDEILSSQTGNVATILIYKGISQMESDQLVEAISTFDQLIESNLLDASKGYWYKSLIYLKMGERQKAEEILEKIKSESLYNAVKASELLEKL